MLHVFFPKYAFICDRGRAVAAIITIVFCLGLSAFGQVEESPANQAVTAFNAGQDAHEKGDLKSALEFYKKAIEFIPDFPEAELQRGSALLSLGQPKEAEKAFRRALEIRGDWTLAMSNLGSILVAKNEMREAERLLTRSIELDPQNGLAYSALTDLRLKEKAEPVVLRALLGRLLVLTSKAKPTASVWASQGALENVLGQNEAARLSAEKAIALDPNNKSALSVLFETTLAENDTAHANDHVLRLEKLGASPAQVLLMKARLLIVQHKPVEALAILNAVESPTPEVVELRNNIAAGQLTNTADLERRLESDAKNPMVLGRLCAKLRTEDPAKALEYCRRASEAEPANVSHAVGYGAALVQSKRYVDAVTLFRRILLIAPDNATVHANMATALFQLKLYNDAKVEFRWLTEKQPEVAASYFFLAVTHDHLQEYLDAMANYQRFLRIAEEKQNGLEIEKVRLRIPILEKQLKGKKVKRNDANR